MFLKRHLGNTVHVLPKPACISLIIEELCNREKRNAHRKGVSEQFYLCGIALNEGGGIDAAAKAGGITKISHVETRTQILFPIIGKRKTVVYGE